jgi:hypothetical protein
MKAKVYKFLCLFKSTFFLCTEIFIIAMLLGYIPVILPLIATSLFENLAFAFFIGAVCADLLASSVIGFCIYNKE